MVIGVNTAIWSSIESTLVETEMPSVDETEIHLLLRELIGAWKRGDAKAYGARYRP